MRRNSFSLIFAVVGMLSMNQLVMAQSRDADFDANGIVDFGDFILFAQAFGSNQSHFDLDGSNSVDFADFILFAKRFGEGAPEEQITVSLLGGAKLEMVWIQPGRFLMGSPVSEPGRRDDEGPQHEVTITKGFYLGKYELTQAQWESVMSTSPWLVGSTTQVPGRGSFPANRMRWHEVQTFIRKLNESEGMDIYRLPTEAEWEYACRAGTTTPGRSEPTRPVSPITHDISGTHAAPPFWTTGEESLEVLRRRKPGADFRTPGACTICMGMYGSSCRITLGRIRKRRRSIPKGPTVPLEDAFRMAATSNEEDRVSISPFG